MSELDDLLRFDPLDAAEKITGESYKTDRETLSLGFGMAMLHNERKAEALRQTRDSHYGMTFAEFRTLLAELGFEEVLVETFAGRDCPETFVIAWSPEGVLAVCESYAGERLNSAKVLYNYRHPNGYPGFGLTSSGSMCGDLWVGDHDAREGVRHNLGRMREAGEFVTPWRERPWLWLLTYMDTKGEYDHEAITAARVARLPEHVRQAISPNGPFRPESGEA